ncbi:hypothetical protein AAE02nite_09600 [Adhaeribacter aerolatus]|uniref:Uncharacterized protein n=1 Tax=Adhaeribacter aerolatus TaxID=670289 RepID=A0A512AUA9_9BACT|nr:hypothetical protein [Adhaeribacter aerolatus]GEO03296.1 hypothetical protein AAE02nite_09600 [Adhaeribacter aerolatus]
MKQFYFSLFFLLSVLGWAQAQTPTQKLSKEPAQFILDVKALMAGTKNENAIKVAARLEEIWGTNTLTSSQQARIIALSQQMQAKKLKARPHLENLYGALVSAVNIHKLNNAALDQFLTVTETALAKEKTPEFEKFLQTSYSFLASKVIYKSPVNTLRVLGGTFTFAYRDGTEPQEEPEPVKPEPVKEAPKKTTKAAPKEGEIVWNDDFKDTPPTPAANAKDPVKTTSDGIPILIGPVLQLNNIDLFFVSGPDSLLLKQTEGALLLARNIFVGKKGQFTWAQPDGEAAVTLKKFSFDISKAAFKADGVTLTYPAILEAPVEGVFEFRNVRRKTPGADTGYPKFISYTNNARLKSIGENIKYQGGLTLAGNKISAGALDGSGSEITVSHSGAPKFKATAANFSLQDSVITSENAAVLLFNKADTIAHPGLRLKYSKPNQKLVLTRSEQAMASPFYSSYHQMEISSEMLTWVLPEQTVNFSILTAKNEVPARLASKEYFTEERYEYLKGTADFHPLIVITNFADKRRTNTFYLSELAQSTKIKEEELQLAASMLAKQNFLDFNPATGQVTVKPKAVHYMKAARGKKDFDFITLKSLMPSGKNITLDLNKNEMLVRGVEKFYFTGDSVAVYAKPDSNQVRILKNREIKFNGAVVAADLRFRGSKFTFKYDEFVVDMAKIDTIAIAAPKKKKNAKDKKSGNEQFSSNSLTKSAGTLYLNKADNKSGRKKYAHFPMFDATGGAFVFFNKPEILGGAYDTTVYFAIPRFKIDSLGTSMPGAVGFKGKFYSGGIFPPIETQLSVMPDQSLGFEYTTPKGGLPAYGGKGSFYNKLSMSNKGLQGTGEVEYLTTRLKSNAFTFYLSKVQTLGTEATIREATVGKAYYMGGTFHKYVMEWLPKKDTMNISTVSEPFKLYGGKYTYQGIAILTPEGFFGDGVVESTDGFIKSPSLAFAKDHFKASNATLEIKSETPGKPALRASDVLLDFNVTKGKATFSPERTGIASTDFPNSQFRTSLSGGMWDVNKKVVTMRETEGKDGSHAYFVSGRPSHEGLKFKAKSASYDISKNTLNIGGVPYIAVADAHVVPDSGRVFIESANLKPLQKAVVVSDTLNKYHQLYQGEINILSRLNYQGNAKVNYVNAAADTFAIKFGKFAMKNMDKVKPVITENDLMEWNNRDKAGLVSTEIMPDDTAAVAEVPVKKGGLFRKASLVTRGKKAKVTTENAPTGDTPLNPESDMAAEPTVASRKKKKNAPKADQEARPDSTLLAMNTADPGKKDRMRFLRKPDVQDETLPHTEAAATVTEKDKFLIAPGVQYKGDIIMSSNQQFWNFDGYVKVAVNGEDGASDWFPYKATVNPAEVKINIEAPKSADGTPLKTGLHVSVANNKIYNTFVSQKKDETDLDVFEVEGQLAYNKNQKEFKLGKPSRIAGEELAGNLMTFNDSTGIASYEGKFNLIQPSKTFKLDAAGAATARPKANLYVLNALLAFDINMPEQALNAMSAALANNAGNAPEAITDNSLLLNKLAQFVPAKEAQAFASQSKYTPLPVFSSKFQKSLVFSNVELRWSDSTKAWYSKNMLSLSNMLKKDINAQVPGYLEIKRGPESDIVTLYLQPNPGLWYYFTYDNSVMMVASTDEEFNRLVTSKRNSGLLTAEEIEKNQFVTDYQKAYLQNSAYDPLKGVAGSKVSAPVKTGNFDFMEDSGGKKKKKDKAAKSDAVDMSQEPAAQPAKPAKQTNDMALPGMTEEPKKKKKAKKGKEDEGLLPDMN